MAAALKGEVAEASEDDAPDLSVYATDVDDGEATLVEDASASNVDQLLPSSNPGPSLTIASAQRKIGAGILTVLDEKFKGKLTEVRHPDTLDRLF